MRRAPLRCAERIWCAVASSCGLPSNGSLFPRRNSGAVPGLELRERRMRQRALQISPYPRHVTQILRLSVAALQARKNPKDFRCALGCERGIERDECGCLELVVDLAA